MKNKLGLGTAAIGRPQYINIRQESFTPTSIEDFKNNGIELIQYAYDLGIRYFDTAPGYGIAEELLIHWNKPKNIELATKWGYTYRANFDPRAEIHEVKEHSIEKLEEQWNTSKALLPYLNTYQIHSATLDTGVLENNKVLDYLANLKALHKLKIGLTTSGANQLDIVKRAMEVVYDGKALFEVYQVTYNIFEQGLNEIINTLAHEQKRVVIKEGLANGRIFPTKRFKHYQPAYEFLNSLASKYGVEVDAIALRFCMDSTSAFMTLSGAANKRHLEENMKALYFELTDEEINEFKKMAVHSKHYWNERKKLAWN